MARAALVTAFKAPVEVRDVQVPELEPTAMLAEVEARPSAARMSTFGKA